jgi:hypothetical protein
MKIVIDIDENLYTRLFDNMDDNGDIDAVDMLKAYVAIRKGTPLPKRHTELVDRQIIADYVHSHIQEINTGYGDLNQHTNRILRMIEDYIDNAPTIIETDKESEEEE